MNEIVKIEGTKLEKIEYNGQVVISLPMVDAVHQRPRSTAGRNFRKNLHRFIFGKDYVDLPYEEWTLLVRRSASHQSGKMTHQKGHKGSMVFLTLSGYLMLVKTFTDDLSWNVQRALVDHYFKATTTVSELKDELLDAYRLIKQLSRRKGNKVQDADNAEIVKLKGQGLQTGQICEKTGWSPTTVKKHVADARQLGLFDVPQIA